MSKPAVAPQAGPGCGSVRKAEYEISNNNNNSNDDSSSSSSSSKRHCTGNLKVCLTMPGNKHQQRHIIELLPCQCTLDYLVAQASQLFGVSGSNVSLKQGFRPHKTLTAETARQLSNLDRILVECEAVEAARPTAPAALKKEDDVVDLTANDYNHKPQNAPVPLSLPYSSNISHNQVPFGSFGGREIYRNRIVDDEEFWTQGHYGLSELVLPGCTSAVVTTFESSGPEYLGPIFGSIPNLLVVKPSSKEKDPSAVIGNGILSPILHGYQWHWLETRPHTGGCLHAKLFLFRSPQGLRLVVSGNNLIRNQQEGQRDVFWAQDFPPKSPPTREPQAESDDESDSDLEFEEMLRTFFKDITACAQPTDQAFVSTFLASVLNGVDFSSHEADLVISFPRPQENRTADRGGYKQLANVIENLLEKKGISPLPHSENSILYAYSGALGNLNPDFVWQMHQAMNGSIVGKKNKKNEKDWNQVEDLFRCFWPSVGLARQMDLVGLHCMRHMPYDHLKTIPKTSLRKVFHNAGPNPPNKKATILPGASQASTEKFFITTHGKFLWNERGDNYGVLYVGSHNFSESAWGARNAQPKNVEVGVVLASQDAQQQEAWRQRFPCELVPTDAVSPASYRPYAGKQDLEQGHPYWPQWVAWEKQQHEQMAAVLSAFGQF